MTVDSIIKQAEKDLVLRKGEGGWVEMGGPGSGHYRHAGRKGKRGGSAPSKGGVLGLRSKEYLVAISHYVPKGNLTSVRFEGNRGLVDAYKKDKRIDKIAYNPTSRMMLLGAADDTHANMVRKFAPDSWYDDFVKIDCLTGEQPPKLRVVLR